MNYAHGIELISADARTVKLAISSTSAMGHKQTRAWQDPLPTKPCFMGALHVSIWPILGMIWASALIRESAALFRCISIEAR